MNASLHAPSADPGPPVPEMLRLKRLLWRGTLWLDVIFLAVVIACWPQFLKQAVMGVGLGFFYLWSLLFNAEFPKRKIQFAFSLMRIVIFAYAIVVLCHASIPEFTIVICGFLSYKVVLTVDAAAQVVSGLRRQAQGRKPSAENALETSRNIQQA